MTRPQRLLVRRMLGLACWITKETHGWRWEYLRGREGVIGTDILVPVPELSDIVSSKHRELCHHLSLIYQQPSICTFLSILFKFLPPGVRLAQGTTYFSVLFSSDKPVCPETSSVSLPADAAWPVEYFHRLLLLFEILSNCSFSAL